LFFNCLGFFVFIFCLLLAQLIYYKDNRVLQNSKKHVSDYINLEYGIIDISVKGIGHKLISELNYILKQSAGVQEKPD
jgi:uncharacterized lipoprotein YehR (DUF1307 family)